MLRGKFWIDALNDRVVDVSMSEHAVYARNQLLRWSKTTPNKCLGPLSKAELKQIESLLPTQRALANLIKKQNDPRVILIEHLSAIRTRENAFYVRCVNIWALACVANADRFWQIQCGFGLTNTDMLRFIGLDGRTVEWQFEDFARVFNVTPRFLADARRRGRDERGRARQRGKTRAHGVG